MTEANPYYVDESQPWFTEEAGWPSEVPKNMEFPKVSLGNFLRDRAKLSPETNAIWFLGHTITYRELDELVDRFAAGLTAAGLKKGDVFAMILPNCFQYVIAYYACARLGVITTGVNPTYKAGEVKHQLKLCGVNAVLYLDSLYETMLAPIIRDLNFKFHVSTNVVDLVGSLSWFKKFLGKKLGKIPTGAPHPESLRFLDLLKKGTDYPQVEIDPMQAHTYIMTGGTTGVPKAAVLSHHNCVSNAYQARAWLYKAAEGLCNVGVLPLFHSFAMTAVMNSSIAVGAWMMLFPRPPAVEELVDTILKNCVDEGAMYCGAEILFQRMTEMPGIENTGINKKMALCISGAGPLHRPVQKAFEEKTNGRLVEGYGLTESSPVISASPFWGNRVIGSIGLPFPGTEWSIRGSNDFTKKLPMVNLDADEEPEQDKHMGEICAAGPQIMMGYLNKPEETAETIIEENGKNWLLTGDIGYMDTHGRIYIRDRKKQLIKVRGYSVYPKEVEELVGAHELVSEVAVAGLPDEEMGEKIKAWVVLKPEGKGKISPDELRAWSKENMTHYKVPGYIEFIDELPKTLVGKVLRRVLQENDPVWIAARGKKEEE